MMKSFLHLACSGAQQSELVSAAFHTIAGEQFGVNYSLRISWGANPLLSLL